MVFDKWQIDRHEQLQILFGDMYCAAHLVNRIDSQVSNYIRSQLGEYADKIESITVNLDYEDFLMLELFVDNRYHKKVYEKVKEVFPGWEWYTEHHNNFSYIYLRLDDDVVAKIPEFMWEE